MIIGASAACTEGTPVDICVSSDGQSNMSADATGIQMTATSSYTEWGHSFRVNVASGSGVIEVRVGNSPDLSTYTAHMQITVTNTSSTNYEQGQWTDSGDNPTSVNFVNTQTYYIGIVQVSGDTVRWQRFLTTTCADQSGRYASVSGVWNMSNTSTADWNHKSIPCN